jgi:hypothetical protein
MDIKLKIWWIFSIVLIVTGCTSVNDNPYYKNWHDQAYASRNAAIGMSGISPQIPVAEGYESNMDSVPVASLNTMARKPLIEEGLYAVENDPFRSYASPTAPLTKRSTGQSNTDGSFVTSH